METSKDEILKVYGADRNGVSYPLAFSFTETVNEKLNEIQEIPSVLVCLIQVTKSLFDKNKQGISAFDQISGIVKKIEVSNSSSGIYSKSLFTTFDSELVCHGTIDQALSRTEVLKDFLLKRSAKPSRGANVINAFNSALSVLDEKFSQFFHDSQKVEKQRYSK